MKLNYKEFLHKFLQIFFTFILVITLCTYFYKLGTYISKLYSLVYEHDFENTFFLDIVDTQILTQNWWFSDWLKFSLVMLLFLYFLIKQIIDQPQFISNQKIITFFNWVQKFWFVIIFYKFYPLVYFNVF